MFSDKIHQDIKPTGEMTARAIILQEEQIRQTLYKLLAGANRQQEEPGFCHWTLLIVVLKHFLMDETNLDLQIIGVFSSPSYQSGRLNCMVGERCQFCLFA